MRTTLEKHSGLEFTSCGADYIGLEFLEHKEGIGSVWLAIPKAHDLATGPVTAVVLLAPDAVTATSRSEPESCPS